MRTTIDLDPTLLRELKQRARLEGKSLGRLASEVLSAALERASPTEPPPPLAWSSRPMGALIDIDDPEAVRRATGGL
ncbi:MAG: antitoxin [Chloroflexota bacterium]